MFYYYNALQTKSGDILPDYLVRLLDASGNEVEIFADNSGTPIISVSGVANAAKADDLGMVRFWVPNGTYDIAIYDTTDTFKGREEGVPMFDAGSLTTDLSGTDGATLVGTPTGTVQGDIDARPTTAALASPGGGEMVGWKPDGADAVARDVFAKLSDAPVSVKDWGAKGDGATNDYTAITNAKVIALATGRALLFPDGEYLHDSTLEFGYSHFRVLFGGQVTLRHTGTGKAISFDGGPTTATQAIDIEFGWGCSPTLIGNANTTDLVYTRAFHHSKLDVRLRDCTTGLRVVFSVLSQFRINGSSNEGSFPSRIPTNWVVIDKRDTAETTTACKFDIIAEGSEEFGVDIISAQHCDFWGTSESNAAGGVWIRSGGNKNNFSNFFCEQNGTAEHWLIDGSYNIFLNCSGGGPLNTGQNNTVVNGIRNLFLRGNFHDVTENQYFNEWQQVQLTGTYSPNADSIRFKCFDEAFAEIPDQTIIAPTLINLWVNAATAGIRNVGWWKDSFGYVHLIGGVKDGSSVMWTLPAGSRPGGTIWRQVWNAAAGAQVIVAVGSNGEVQHVSGPNNAVPLDGISFLAEN